MTDYFRAPRKTILLWGFIAGLVLGIIARAWMRWISTDPEFSWAGSSFIVLAFGLFGTAHSVAFISRKRDWPRRRVNMIRVASILCSLPLFTAAGASMLPTVLTGSLARWRTDWWPWLRWSMAVISVLIPIFLIRGFGNDFGWTLATLGRSLLFVAIYSAVITATRSAVSPIAKT